MARVKLTARKHVRVPPRRNVVPTESHSDGQNAGYFLRTLRTVLLAQGYSDPTFHRCPEAASRELIPLACVGDHLREANHRSYLPHLSRGRGYHTEVDIRGRHERGCMRSFGAATT
jgi:hypothetical protein